MLLLCYAPALMNRIGRARRAIGYMSDIARADCIMMQSLVRIPLPQPTIKLLI
jgi:hypothetical protein